MRHVIQILGIGLMSISLTYGCDVTNRKDISKPLIAQAQAITKSDYPKNNMVKIALLLDTSNSMDGLINQAKAQLWDIVNEFTRAKCGNSMRPELQIAIYQYGNDGLSAREGYIQQILDFSNDLDEISEKLFSLTTNGGEEFCGQVIQTSLRQLEWDENPDNLKMIFIAGNEPFNQGKLNYQDAITNAKEKGVIVNTIFCGDYEQGIASHWKNGALWAGGEYMSIDHNRHTVHIDTPYDEIIIELNSKLNQTYISYGSLGKAKMKKQYVQDANAYEMEADVAVKRAVSKSSRLYKNEQWDLVDASAQDDFDINQLDAASLPEELKEKNASEIASYIEEKKSERRYIQKEIQELNIKRENYLAEHQKESDEGQLENAMLQAIKKQAADKNYQWE
ncbi:vWA domain-containing protein [Pareuzebyella sediminis]|uniref:vWA domain-containing protein n=1 Tax=Pareuzebyella sediminis TaxID=2607998 RepID=UPI0011EDB868|nr:vWA domain-containing protein [Pareuzebyella sediminis]